MGDSNNVAVSFTSDAFNVSEPKDYFINPCCYGDDLAVWLAEGLKQRGIEVEDGAPGQEDFGWYLNFRCDNINYSLVVLHHDEPDQWLCIIEYNAGLLGSLLGKRKKRVPAAPAIAIDSVLRSHPKVIRDIRWENIEIPSIGSGN